MRTSLLLVAAALSMGGARLAAGAARRERSEWPALLDTPYAPSPSAAPFVSLGFREALADLLWIRAVGYFGGDDKTSEGIQTLIDSIVALDPQFKRAYVWGGVAVAGSRGGDSREAGLWAARLLESGMPRFPDSWEFPMLAGQVYIVDLDSDDPDEKSRWNERGAMLFERAVRLPGAPEGIATQAAEIRTRLGQHERAVSQLREMILLTNNERVRTKLINKLEKLEEKSAAAIRDELEEDRRRFEAVWLAERPELPSSMYVLLGPRPAPRFDLGELAVERDLFGAEDRPAPLEPLYEEEAPDGDPAATEAAPDQPAPAVLEPPPAAP